MEIYNETKTEQIENPDLEMGHLVEDKLLIKHHDAVAEVPAKSVNEVVDELITQGKQVEEIRGKKYLIKQVFENGGREVEEVKSVPAVPAIEAYDEYEDIFIYKPYTEAELLENKKNKFRAWRAEYFEIIDRATFVISLSKEKQDIVIAFREALLKITDTLEYPEIPDFVQEIYLKEHPNEYQN